MPFTLGPAFCNNFPDVSPIAFASFCDCSSALPAYSCALAAAFEAVSDAREATCFAEPAALVAVSLASARDSRDVCNDRPHRWGRNVERSIGLSE